MIKPGDAGYSASRRAVKLYAAHAKSSLMWAGGAGGGAVAAVSMPTGGLSVVSLVAGGAAGVGTAVWLLRRPGDWQRWLQGAKAEWRTGQRLNNLRKEGWGVLHDRTIPGSRANLDHVLVHPSGLFLVYVDTKAWHAVNARIRIDRGRLMYGPWNQGSKIETIEWEASRLGQAIGLPVIRVVAVDRGRVDSDAVVFRGTNVVSSGYLCSFLRGLNATAPVDANRVRQITCNIGREFVPAR